MGVQKCSTVDEIKAIQGVVVIDFTAVWCGPCRVIKPVFEALSEQFAGKVTFVTVDVDEAEAVAAAYKISAMPTFVLLKDGEEVKRFQGANKEGLEAMVAEAAA